MHFLPKGYNEIYPYTHRVVVPTQKMRSAEISEKYYSDELNIRGLM